MDGRRLLRLRQGRKTLLRRFRTASCLCGPESNGALWLLVIELLRRKNNLQRQTRGVILTAFFRRQAFLLQARKRVGESPCHLELGSFLPHPAEWRCQQGLERPQCQGEYHPHLGSQSKHVVNTWQHVLNISVQVNKKGESTYLPLQLPLQPHSPPSPSLSSTTCPGRQHELIASSSFPQSCYAVCTWGNLSDGTRTHGQIDPLDVVWPLRSPPQTAQSSQRSRFRCQT